MAKKKSATKKKAVAKKRVSVKKSVKTTRTASALKADRARVSKQGPELAYVAKKFGVTKEVVIKAIAKVGNMRTAVYAALTTFKARSKAADHAKVSRQPHEVAYLAKKFNTSTDAVMGVLEKHGSSRKKVEAALGGS
jgi:hypothetical protein